MQSRRKFTQPSSERAGRVLTLVLLSTFGLTWSVPASAQTFTGFEPIDAYQLEVDGKLDAKAEIFLQRKLPAFLVLPAGSNTPLLVAVRSRAVQSVNIMKMTKSDAGTMDLASDAVIGVKGSLEQDDSGFSFVADGRRYRLVEKPDFLGLSRASALEQYSDSYRDLALAYEPDQASLKAIQEAKGRVQVRIYHGSWCPFCKRYVPRVIKVSNLIKKDNITIDFYGLPKGISSDPVAGQARINSVPTGVIFVDGKEVGRIEKDDWQAPEKALAKLLAGR